MNNSEEARSNTNNSIDVALQKVMMYIGNQRTAAAASLKW